MLYTKILIFKKVLLGQFVSNYKAEHCCSKKIKLKFWKLTIPESI